MKKYESLGQLLVDYRNLNGISQADFAASMDIDIRTTQRWEKNTSLLKPDKEIKLVSVCFFPYQLVRNLNSSNPIPTYYDFRLRKYSLSEISKEMPNLDWVKQRMGASTEMLRSIERESDYKQIVRFSEIQYDPKHLVEIEVLWDAAKLLPELNKIYNNEDGFYLGHSAILPIRYSTYEKLCLQKISSTELTRSDLVDYKKERKLVFYGYSITADSNESFYYIVGNILNFFEKHSHLDYLYCALTGRYDDYESIESLKMNTIWQEEQKNGYPVRFYTGDLKEYFL